MTAIFSFLDPNCVLEDNDFVATLLCFIFNWQEIKFSTYSNIFSFLPWLNTKTMHSSAHDVGTWEELLSPFWPTRPQPSNILQKPQLPKWAQCEDKLPNGWCDCGGVERGGGWGWKSMRGISLIGMTQNEILIAEQHRHIEWHVVTFTLISILVRALTTNQEGRSHV